MDKLTDIAIGTFATRDYYKEHLQIVIYPTTTKSQNLVLPLLNSSCTLHIIILLPKV